MAQKNRQVRMFAAEDYFAVYDSYINANFQAFDFDTIRNSMITYIQAQYPENFNDWIESSDFVALLDVVAQFGHNLAFRADLNSRNNFLSTSERQDSVFKLAEFLGYVPRRNIPANGQLKIVSVKTNEQVLGSDGSTLAGKELRFENSSTSATLDDFIAVMNSVFSISNQFGNPRKTATINGVTNEFYNLNNLANQIVFEFTGNVAGTSRPFNVVGLNYDSDLGRIYENTPDPASQFTLVYKNDGRGLSSKNTGFFVGFKQGSLAFKDFSISEPISNMTLDIAATNINNDDIWVETINENGDVLQKWTKVQNINGFSEIFNNIDPKNRYIFAAKTGLDNSASIMFPDESFGELPRGIIRVWYRTGVNQSYVLRSEDIGSKKINVKYTGIDGNNYTVNFGLGLQETINNASASETLDEIKTNAPRAFSAQDRMITGDDYNNYLITQSTQIAKIKSVNRTHSGHSRYINPMDPTGKYSNLNLYATDGKIQVKETLQQNNTNNISAELIFDRYIKPQLENQELINLYYHKWKTTMETITNGKVYTWQPVDSTTGYFRSNATGNPVVSNKDGGIMDQVRVGSLVKIGNSWARVVSLYNSGLGVDSGTGAPSGLDHRGIGAVALDREIKSSGEFTKVYAPFPRQFTKTERNSIISLLKADNVDEFVIYFNYHTQEFIAEQVNNINTAEDFPGAMGAAQASNWLIHCKISATGTSYDVTTRVVKYTVSSEQIVFSNINNEYQLDYYTKKSKRDNIDFIIDGVEYGNFYVYGYDFDMNGVYYNDRVNVVLEDGNNDSRPDNPELYYDMAAVQTPTDNTISNLRFEWKHIPDNNQIIDPSFSNIIDAFILTKSYDTEFRNWLITNDNVLLDIPLTPTSDELTRQFANTTDKKSISDTIVYNPVKYKVLFGEKATQDARASFQAIRAAGSKITDNEIKSVIVDAIYEFFAIENWDFGETFYFTELAAYVHKKLTGEISSFVIVPESANSMFGKLFQITPMSDELFIPDVSITDIDIVANITQENIKAG
jgi:hypothetical protein